MFPFWDLIVAPLIDIVRPTRVVEIGALRGDTTARLLDQLGEAAELHVIDPAPLFDPEDHERRFPGRYVFHRDLSLNVLPTLPPVDLALIDGDHNWYTVFNELELLRRRAREQSKPAPVLVLHDVSWPYGRRDGYYAPERIPFAYRQPNERRGLERGNAALADEGGLNTHIWNARTEGGPRNGVLTALEDFVAEHFPEFQHTVVDVFVGLAIGADRERLAACPDLTAMLGRLATADATADLRRRAAAVASATFATEP